MINMFNITCLYVNNILGFDCTLYLVFVREIFEPRDGDRRNKVKIIRPAPGEPTSSLNPTAITWWTPVVPTYSR